MANKLINQSTVERSAVETKEELIMPEDKPVPRCYLYNESGGQLFVGDDIEKALKEGWQDTPLPPEEFAQSPSGDDESASRIVELEEALDAANAEITAANTKANDEKSRADAAEKKLAAAAKKAAASDAQ